MKLILITPDVEFSNEHDLIGELFKNGLGCLHIRKPGYSKGQLESYLNAIPDLYHKRCVLHYDHEQYEMYKLAGFHISEKQRRENLKLDFKSGRGQTLSTSFHNVYDKESKSEKYSYAFFSPVFKSISKEHYAPSYSLNEISSFAQVANMDVYALGGVNIDNIKKISGKGFAGVAVLGSVWYSSDPMASFLELQDLLGSL